MRVELLNFAQVRDAFPERWEKARPGNQFVNPHNEDPGCYLVRRQGSDEWHEVTLVLIGSDYYGVCDCMGFENHDGPCSHLCSVRRIFADEREAYSPRAIAAIVELRSQDEERAQVASEPDVTAAADGGTRRW